MSSYRYSEGSSLFRRSVLHRIRFGNTLRLRAEFVNSAASSLRTNDLLGSDRRPSSSLSAYPDQWMHHHHRRLSDSPHTPLPALSTDDLPCSTRILSQRTLDNIPAALGIQLPNVSDTPLTPTNKTIELEKDDKSSCIQIHSPNCIHTIEQSNNTTNDSIKQIRTSIRKKHHLHTNNNLISPVKIVDIASDPSSESIDECIDVNSTATKTTLPNSTLVCTCQLLWQLERDTDSIDKFKLFFKRDHLNVDWDYVQGSSEV